MVGYAGLEVGVAVLAARYPGLPEVWRLAVT